MLCPYEQYDNDWKIKVQRKKVSEANFLADFLPIDTFAVYIALVYGMYFIVVKWRPFSLSWGFEAGNVIAMVIW